MRKQDESLFKVGEVIRIMGITRKALLVYEAAGLLTPAVKDEESGYRYYSADNMAQIRAIRSLQQLGLTLKEIRDYYYNTECIDAHLARLMELRAVLDKNIQMLQVRAAKPGDMTIRKTTLARQVCFVRRHQCQEVSEATIRLRETYVAAARTGKISMDSRMFTMRLSPSMEKPELMCCIPMENDYNGPERMEFVETPALCIYYRGPYEGIGNAVAAMMAHVKENRIEITGPFRSIFLEGPPNRGENSGDYITQIALPIRE